MFRGNSELLITTKSNPSVSNMSKLLLTLLTIFAPNQAESTPYGGGRTFTPSDMDGGRSLWSSFSNLSEID